MNQIRRRLSKLEARRTERDSVGSIPVVEIRDGVEVLLWTTRGDTSRFSKIIICYDDPGETEQAEQ